MLPPNFLTIAGRMSGTTRKQLTQSVSKRPGRTALTRTFSPWVWARHFMRCSPLSLLGTYMFFALWMGPYLLPWLRHRAYCFQSPWLPGWLIDELSMIPRWLWIFINSPQPRTLGGRHRLQGSRWTLAMPPWASTYCPWHWWTSTGLVLAFKTMPPRQRFSKQFLTLSHSSSFMACKSPKFVTFVHPWQRWSASSFATENGSWNAYCVRYHNIQSAQFVNGCFDSFLTVL